MRKDPNFLSYVFIALCSTGFVFPILPFIQVEKNTHNRDSKITLLADTTVTIIFEPLALSDPPAGKFEPGQQANTAIDSFESLWNNAPSGIIQLNRSNITKSDLFSITAIDSLLQLSSATRPAKYLTIIKGIDSSTGLLKSYLALVDSKMKIIRMNANETYIQDAVRCPDNCAE